MQEMAQNEQDTTESEVCASRDIRRIESKQVAKSVEDPLVLVAAVLRTFLPGNALLAALGLSEDGILAPGDSPPSAEVGTN